MSKRFVLVTGATGKQGRAVAESLLAMGHKVRALVRKQDADVPAGAEKVVGAFDDKASLKKAADGVDTVFLMTTPFVAGPEAETQQGINVIDAAVASDTVHHVVFSSVSDAQNKTHIPHFDSKFAVEQYLAKTDLNWTVTAPVFFYENVFFGLDYLKKGVFSHAMPADRKLQMVSVRDIGRFNAHVISHLDEFVGKRIDYAGDEITGVDMAAAMSRASGREIAYQPQPLEQLREMNMGDFAEMYEWFDKVGYSADVVKLKKEYPGVEWMTFSQWADQQDWATLLG